MSAAIRIHDYLEHWAQADPARRCLTDGERSWTYAEVDDWANRVAAALADRELADGARVGILARNCPDWVALYYGAFKCGAVPVPLNFRLHPSEWAYLLTDSGAAAVIAQEEFVGLLDGLGEAFPAGVTTKLVIDGDPDEVAEGWHSLPAVLADVAPRPRPSDRRAGDQDLWQMYTSGTTGLPKGAVVTHASVNANQLQMRTSAPVLPSDHRLVVMPLYHAGAAMSMIQVIAAGASLRTMAKFEPAECVRVIDDEQVSHLSLVPAMIHAMIRLPDLTHRRFASLRTISYGASPITEDTLRTALDIFNCGFQQAFGQTETSAALTMLDARAHERALAGEPHLLRSCGRALVGTELAVVDTDGKPVDAGVVGEVVARGPQMMRGYWNLPDATAETLVDGWLRTGDAGYLDEEGFLYLSDRMKDLIVSGGENIYPREIEEILARMPGVSEAAVIGVPDARWGESVKACVVLETGGTASEDAVISWCREHLATYKAPRSVDFLEALPRNPSGKVLKRELRAPYWADQARQVG
ncbi:long-chain fatty acid--CoA ligase [Sporichthya brevicatena]|uniref:Long-chain fatty acid--CoA ligase n=1 Tax=Sporichthya brevicatena TaxID=171442 RepID=A0ABN1GIH4_9ACTN